MIKNSQRQVGSAHVIIVIILVIALIGLLGFVFWKNVVDKKPASTNQTALIDKTGAANSVSENKTEEVQYEEYMSSTGSGLSFKYPATWLLQPSDKALKNLSGGEMTTYSLLSEAYKLDPNVTSAPKTINQYFCLTFTEYKGEWAYSNSIDSSNEIKSEAFNVGATTYYLKTYKDSSLGRDSKPMGNIMRLVASSSTNSLPLNYLKADNGYVVEAVAQFNCIEGGEGIKNLDDDFFIQPETTMAIKSLKSIRFN